MKITSSDHECFIFEIENLEELHYWYYQRAKQPVRFFRKHIRFVIADLTLNDTDNIILGITFSSVELANLYQKYESQAHSCIIDLKNIDNSVKYAKERNFVVTPMTTEIIDVIKPLLVKCNKDYKVLCDTLQLEFKVCKRGKVAIFHTEPVNDIVDKHMLRSYEYQVYAVDDIHAYASLLQLAESAYNIDDEEQEFFDDHTVAVPKNSTYNEETSSTTEVTNMINPMMMMGMGMGAGNNSNFAQKMMNRFIRKVDNVVWDLSTGKIGFVNEDGEILSLEGEGEDAQIAVNPFDQFGVPIPAFAQNVPASEVQIGDLIYSTSSKGEREVGWIIEKQGTKKSFRIMRPGGSSGNWTPLKVQCLGIDGGVMVLRSLDKMLGGNMAGMQSMLLPMMMMGGDMDFESVIPMMLMTSMSSTTASDGTTAPNPLFGQGNNFMQVMMQMQMFKMFAGNDDGSSGSNLNKRKSPFKI